jgi:hypothetical protein
LRKSTAGSARNGTGEAPSCGSTAVADAGPAVGGRFADINGDGKSEFSTIALAQPLIGHEFHAFDHRAAGVQGQSIRCVPVIGIQEE